MPYPALLSLLLFPRVAIPSSGLDRTKMQQPVLPRRKPLAPLEQYFAAVRRCNARSRVRSYQTFARRSAGERWGQRWGCDSRPVSWK